MNKSKTLYFIRKKKKRFIANKLSNYFYFDYNFNIKKDIYLENQKYLIIISKHYIRVLVFNEDDVWDITNQINRINIEKL